MAITFINLKNYYKMNTEKIKNLVIDYHNATDKKNEDIAAEKIGNVLFGMSNYFSLSDLYSIYDLLNGLNNDDIRNYVTAVLFSIKNLQAATK